MRTATRYALKGAAWISGLIAVGIAIGMVLTVILGIADRPALRLAVALAVLFLALLVLFTAGLMRVAGNTSATEGDQFARWRAERDRERGAVTEERRTTTVHRIHQHKRRGA